MNWSSENVLSFAEAHSGNSITVYASMLTLSAYGAGFGGSLPQLGLAVLGKITDVGQAGAGQVSAKQLDVLEVTSRCPD